MAPDPDPHHRRHFPAEIIAHTIRLYPVFRLSLRTVALMLAERGVPVAHEAIRRWCRTFGQSFAAGTGQQVRKGDEPDDFG